MKKVLQQSTASDTDITASMHPNINQRCVTNPELTAASRCTIPLAPLQTGSGGSTDVALHIFRVPDRQAQIGVPTAPISLDTRSPQLAHRFEIHVPAYKGNSARKRLPTGCAIDMFQFVCAPAPRLAPDHCHRKDLPINFPMALCIFCFAFFSATKANDLQRGLG
jgi:hypothetical protein